jgi:hypothetical protein
MTSKRVTAPMSMGLRTAGVRFDDIPAVRGVLRLTRRGRILALLVVTVLLFVAFSVGRVSSSNAAAPAAPVVEHSVIVTSGETLWSIAQREAPGRDPREVVDLLQRTNHLTGMLRAGQRLVLPAMS